MDLYLSSEEAELLSELLAEKIDNLRTEIRDEDSLHKSSTMERKEVEFIEFRIKQKINEIQKCKVLIERLDFSGNQRYHDLINNTLAEAEEIYNLYKA